MRRDVQHYRRWPQFRKKESELLVLEPLIQCLEPPVGDDQFLVLVGVEGTHSRAASSHGSVRFTIRAYATVWTRR